MKITGYILIAVLLVWGFVALFTKGDDKILPNYKKAEETRIDTGFWETEEGFDKG